LKIFHSSSFSLQFVVPLSLGFPFLSFDFLLILVIDSSITYLSLFLGSKLEFSQICFWCKNYKEVRNTLCFLSSRTDCYKERKELRFTIYPLIYENVINKSIFYYFFLTINNLIWSSWILVALKF